MSYEIPSDKAAFIEEKTRLLLDYTVDSYDRARAEGNNILQWLFGVITGGMALLGVALERGYNSVAVGAGAAICVAAFTAMLLVREMRAHMIFPPGNTAKVFNAVVDSQTLEMMRWAEATNHDTRITANRGHVVAITKAIDTARMNFASIPFWFVGGILATLFVRFFFLD